MTAWQQFQTLIDIKQASYPYYANCDLFFFRHDSIQTELPVLACHCLDFIRSIFPKPCLSLLTQEMPDSGADAQEKPTKLATKLLPAQYDELILVGHSQGAVMLRAAIWSAFRDASDPANLPDLGTIADGRYDNFIMMKDPVLTADLCLFAPAILGSNLPVLIAQLVALLGGIRGFGPEILKALGIFFPAVTHLQSGDPFLSNMRTYTEQAREDYPRVRALTARVLWGEEDRTVQMWQYKRDAPVEYEAGVGHQGVCKPHAGFLKPLDFVIYGRQKASAAR